MEQPSVTIILGAAPPNHEDESLTKQKVAKEHLCKVKKQLTQMLSQWQPKTSEGKAYNDELSNFVAALER